MGLHLSASIRSQCQYSSSKPSMGESLDAPDNHGSLVNIVVWFTLVLSVLAVSARCVIKWLLQRRLHGDDALITISTVFSIGLTVSVSIEVANGLGQHASALQDSELVSYQKATYATGVLYVATICTSRLSILQLIRSLSPGGLFRWTLRVSAGLTLVWSFVSVLVVLFQCHPPNFWQSLNNSCVNVSAFWIVFSATSCALEAPVIILPFILVWNLQMAGKHRYAVVGIFSTRALVIAAFVAQIILLSLPASDADSTWASYPITISLVVTQTLSIMTACMVYLRPLLEALDSGMIRSDDINRRYRANIPLSNKIFSSGKSRPNNSVRFQAAFGNSAANARSLSSQRPWYKRYMTAGPGPGDSLMGTQVGTSRPERDADRNSQGSQSRLIHQTVEWTVSRSPPDRHGNEQGVAIRL